MFQKFEFIVCVHSKIGFEFLQFPADIKNKNINILYVSLFLGEMHSFRKVVMHESYKQPFFKKERKLKETKNEFE